MIVIPPIPITPAMLTSSTVPYPDTARGEVAWATGTFAVGDERVHANKLWSCVQAHAGRTATPDADAAYWLFKRYANKFAMFDTLRSTPTVATSPLTVVIAPGERVDSIALTKMQAHQASITIDQGATRIYSESINLVDRPTRSWYDYFFRKITLRENEIRFNLPPVSNGVITVTLTHPTADVQIGNLDIGMQEYVGRVQFAPTDDADNYSKITRSVIDGSATLTPSVSVPKTSQTILVDKADVPRIRRLRDRLNAVRAIWCGLDEKSTSPYFQSLLISGIYRRMPINLKHLNHAEISLELEEI